MTEAAPRATRDSAKRQISVHDRRKRLATNLISPESLRARELVCQGRPALALGVPAAFVNVVSVMLALAMAALIAFGTHARRVDMEGSVLPSAGLIAITSPSSGWVEELAVRESEACRRGPHSYTLDLDTTTKDGGTQQADH